MPRHRSALPWFKFLQLWLKIGTPWFAHFPAYQVSLPIMLLLIHPIMNLTMSHDVPWIPPWAHLQLGSPWSPTRPRDFGAKIHMVSGAWTSPGGTFRPPLDLTQRGHPGSSKCDKSETISGALVKSGKYLLVYCLSDGLIPILDGWNVKTSIL